MPISSEDSSDWSHISASSVALRSENPIRQIVDGVMSSKSTNKARKKDISLAIGDPTVFCSPPPALSAAISQVLEQGQGNAYTHSAGSHECREAIAKWMARPKVAASDVIVTVGCSQALQMCLTALADPTRGATVLLPQPVFPLYTTICQHIGVNFRFYRLRADKDWEIDLDHLESLVDSSTACILICNPSNPTGSVFSETHLRAIVATAEKLKVPILSDEVYADMVFPGQKFISIAQVSTNVPSLVVGALSKRFLVPGWRLGWIIAHDRHDILHSARVLDALIRLSQITIGTSTLVQAAVPHIFDALMSDGDRHPHSDSAANNSDSNSQVLHAPAREDYLTEFMSNCQASLAIAIEQIERIACLTCTSEPKGAMYLMVKIDFSQLHSITTDEEFCRQLYAEQSVLCIPGTAFQLPGYFRVVLSLPGEMLREALERVGMLCENYARK